MGRDGASTRNHRSLNRAKLVKFSLSNLRLYPIGKEMGKGNGGRRKQERKEREWKRNHRAPKYEEIRRFYRYRGGEEREGMGNNKGRKEREGKGMGTKPPRS